MNLSNIHKAILVWMASLLLVGLSSEFKKPTLSILSFLVGTGATVFITKSNLNDLVTNVDVDPITPTTEPIVTTTAPIKKIEAPIKQHTPPKESSNWDAICAEAKTNPESGAAILKGLLEPLSLWKPIIIGGNKPLDILGVMGGTIYHKGTEVPTDLQIHIALSDPIEWKQAAQWVKTNQYLGFNTALDSKGYTYSPHVKVSLPREGEGQIITLSISIEGNLKQ